jgi:AcrR family transcriptional regulator
LVAEVAIEGRRERKKRELRSRIYETARQLFLERGFEATTVAEIARAADVAEGTFFNHFPSKQAVLAEISREVAVHLQGMLDEQLARPVSVPERIQGFAERVASELSGARTLARDVILELMRTSARPGEAYPYLVGVHEPFRRVLRDGQQRGEVRGDFAADFLAELVVGALHTAVTHWLVDPDYPLEVRLHQTAAFVTEAIRPREPTERPAAPRARHKEE